VLGIAGVGDDAATPTAPPAGWYPDPAGLPQWRRWEGATWGAATMPFGPPPPDGWVLAQDRASSRFLHVVAPWGLVAPAFGAVAYAADSSTFGPIRRWLHAAMRAVQHNRPLPPMPTTRTATAITYTYTAVWLVTIVGVGAWLRYTLAAMRTVAAAGYPSRRRAVWTCLGFLVPFVGPFIAWGASREWLPTGHEATRVLGVGWTLVAVGELTGVALWITALASSSAAATWALAVVSAIVWVAAAVELPRGLEAIAEDHASLGVRRAAAAS